MDRNQTLFFTSSDGKWYNGEVGMALFIFVVGLILSPVLLLAFILITHNFHTYWYWRLLSSAVDFRLAIQYVSSCAMPGNRCSCSLRTQRPWDLSWKPSFPQSQAAMELTLTSERSMQHLLLIHNTPKAVNFFSKQPTDVSLAHIKWPKSVICVSLPKNSWVSTISYVLGTAEVLFRVLLEFQSKMFKPWRK